MSPAVSGGRVLVMLVAVTGLSQFFRASQSAIAPELTRELGLAPDALGLANGSFFVALGLAQIPVGSLFDRYGPRRTIAALTVLAVAGALVHAAATGAGELVVARLLLGFGCGGSFMGAVVLCGRWYAGARFTTVLSWVFAASNLGTLLATTPLAAGARLVGWRWAFVAAAVLTAALGALFWLLVRDAPGAAATRGATAESLAETLRGFREVWRVAGLVPVLAIHTFVYASVITVLGLWAGPYLHDVHHLDPIARGNVLLAMGAAQIVGILCYGPIDRLVPSRRRIVVAGALLTIACLAALALIPHPPVALAAALLVALCFVTAYGIVIVAQGRSLFPDRLVGRGVTTVNLAQVLGSALLPILTGALVAGYPAEAGASPEAAYRLAFGAIALALSLGLVVYACGR